MNLKFRYKGRYITNKQYQKRFKQIEGGKKGRKEKKEDDAEDTLLEGRRICELKVMADSLFCTFCKAMISLHDTEKEIRKGFVSIFLVRCYKCLYLNSVPTGKIHTGPQETKMQLSYDTNSKFALGTLHAGLGHSSLNKVFHVMNMPMMSPSTFKRYEREKSPFIESVAQESCKKACDEERNLTLSKCNELKRNLPAATENNFLIPDRSNEEFYESDSNNNHEKVRVFASYDMGWSTRRSGHQYDSLSGTGHLIGVQSGKVLNYETRNRKCAMCDKHNEKNNHDCRKNFYGSAKAMEPHVATHLVTNNKNLKEKNIEIGVFIADNDSSSICAIRKASSYNIVKQSDTNHTSKGVKSLLYKIDKSKDLDKELTPEVIKYLHKCFTYALAQHKGNSVLLAAAINNIPDHAFNIHKNCGDWCGYSIDKENYNHSTIIGGLKSEILCNELKSIFSKLANNAETFVIGASTQSNESLNSIISRRAPKALSYNKSESYDFRVASAIAQKNEGEQYVQNTLQKYSLRPGKNLSKHIERTMKFSKLRANKATSTQFKLNRHRLKKIRLQLKYNQEIKEGETYKRNVGLLKMPAIEPIHKLPTELTINSKFLSNSVAVIFFALETGGFNKRDDILQISMKFNNLIFNKNIDPTKDISSKATAVHGLTNINQELYLHGNKVISSSIRIILGELLEYLKSIGQLCILVAHNCSFDAHRLFTKINEANLNEEFSKVISGFVDTLQLFEKRFPDRKGPGMFKLTTLSTDLLQLSTYKAHDAIYDVLLLEQLTSKFFTLHIILNNVKTFDFIAESQLKTEKSKSVLNTLQPLKAVISKVMLKRLAEADICFQLLLSVFKKSEVDAIILLEQKLNGKAQVIKSNKVLHNILDCLRKFK